MKDRREMYAQGSPDYMIMQKMKGDHCMENEVTVFMQQGAPTRHADEQVGLNDDVYRDIRQLLEGRGHEVPDEPGMTPMVEALPVSAIRSLADKYDLYMGTLSNTKIERSQSKTGRTEHCFG